MTHGWPLGSFRRGLVTGSTNQVIRGLECLAPPHSPSCKGQEVEFNYVYVTKPQYKTLKKGVQRASGEDADVLSGWLAQRGRGSFTPSYLDLFGCS